MDIEALVVKWNSSRAIGSAGGIGQIMIINVRGNSGSGKTHLTRQFMALGSTEAMTTGEGRVWGYKTRLKGGSSWIILGKYTNACGGCDTVKTQAEIISCIDEWSPDYNVWLEGLLISGMYGSVGAFSEDFGDNWIFAFLDTPLKLCIKRIQQRRKSAGTCKPFNPDNTINRHAIIARTRERLLEMKRRVIDLPHQDALEPLLKIIRREG